LFKIGRTTRTVDIRAKELYNTSSPDKFLIAMRYDVQDCILAEKLIHDKLDSYRINDRREFFKIDFKLANKTILEIINEINNKI
jgi:hypothetical protein